MKVFIVLLFTVSSFASEFETCQKFVEKVLQPSYTEVVGTDDHGYRFVKDEAKALELIKSYDASKLAYPYAIRLANQMKTDCKVAMDKTTQDNYCQSQFANYNYLRALIYGMKSYGWKPATVNLGHQKIKDYFKAVNQEGNPLLEVAVATSLLAYYVTEFPSEKLKANEAIDLKYEADGATRALQKKSEKKSYKKCPDIQSSMNEETKIANGLQKKLNTLISRL